MEEMHKTISTKSETKEAIELPFVGVFQMTRIYNENELVRSFEAMFMEREPKAILFVGYVSGTVPSALLPAIRESIEKGISVFVLASNYGSDRGIQEITYESQRDLVQTGAVILKNANTNNAQNVFEAIREAAAQGLKGDQLRDAIVQKFGATE